MSRRDAEILYGWLERAALAHHFEAFQRSNIGISQLVTLGQNDYAAFGIIDLTDRRKMFDLNSLLRWLRFLRSFLVPAFNVPLQFMCFFHVPADDLNHPHKLSRIIFVLTRLDPIQLIKKTNYFDTCVDMEIEDEKENREDLLNLQVRFFSFFCTSFFSVSAIMQGKVCHQTPVDSLGERSAKRQPLQEFRGVHHFAITERFLKSTVCTGLLICGLFSKPPLTINQNCQAKLGFLQGGWFIDPQSPTEKGGGSPGRKIKFVSRQSQL